MKIKIGTINPNELKETPESRKERARRQHEEGLHKHLIHEDKDKKFKKGYQKHKGKGWDKYI